MRSTCSTRASRLSIGSALAAGTAGAGALLASRLLEAARKTGSEDALIATCVQDLHAGKVQLVRRLPPIAAAVGDPTLRALIEEGVGRALAHARRLEETGVDTAGPANLWMSGILDDAQRDTRSIEPGRPLDLALIGAVRKARAAEIVSSETALALADAQSRRDVRRAVAANRGEEIASEQALKARLLAMAGPVRSDDRPDPAARRRFRPQGGARTPNGHRTARRI